jgi:hypothetical protein
MVLSGPPRTVVGMHLVDDPHFPTPAELAAERDEMIDSFLDQLDAIDAARVSTARQDSVFDSEQRPEQGHSLR